MAMNTHTQSTRTVAAVNKSVNPSRNSAHSKTLSVISFIVSYIRSPVLFAPRLIQLSKNPIPHFAPG